jgi:hypothetical protein
MAAEWLTAELKREFCRATLECSPEIERLQQRFKTVHPQLAIVQEIPKIPAAWRELCGWGIGTRLPTLKRHAVFALVENAGEPLPEVIDEFFLRQYRDQESTESVSEGVLDLIALYAEDLGADVVRKRVGKAIKCGHAPVRQAAYRLGAEQFGLDFVRPALKDDARRVRDWATKLLATKDLRPARKAARNKRAETPAR